MWKYFNRVKDMKHCLAFVFIFCSIVVGAQPLLIPYRDGKKWGYCDKDGKVLIQPQWDAAELFTGNKAVVTIDTAQDKWGNGKIVCIIDETGKYIIPPSFHWNGEWDRRGNLNAYGNDGKGGMIDTNGIVKIPFRYDRGNNVRYHNCGNRLFTSVLRNGKEGMVNESGVEVLPATYRVIPDCYTSNPPTFYAYISLDTVVLIDTTQRIIYMFEKGSYAHLVKRLSRYTNAILLRDNKKVFYWKDYPNGTPKQLPYDDIILDDEDSRGWIMVKQGAHYGLIDTNGKELLKPLYDQLYLRGKVIIAENSLLANKDPRARYEHAYLDPAALQRAPKMKPTEVSEIERYTRQQAEHSETRQENEANRNNNIIPVDKVLYADGHPVYQKGKYIIDLGQYDRDVYTAYTPAAIYDAGTKKLLGNTLVHEDFSLASPLTQWQIPKFSSISLMAYIQEGDLYGLADTNMKQVIAFQKYPVDGHNYIVHNGKPYVLVSNYGPANDLSSNRGYMFIGADGKVPPQFEPYINISPAMPYTGYRDSKYFIVKDKQGRTGVIDFDGRVQYSEVSFKQDIKNYYEDGLFLLGNGKLVDRHGSPLLNDITLQVITPAFYKHFAGSNDYDVAGGLYKVFLPAPNGRQSYFYIGTGGQAYVGSWDF